MNCERAQELMTDYLDGALPLSAFNSMEVHLQHCESCREDLEAIRFTCAALAALPAVEPPADGEWQVIRRLRENRTVQPVSSRPQGFLAWLRLQSPLALGAGAALATLIVGGVFFATGVPHTQWGLLPGPAPTPAQRPLAVNVEPSLSITYGAVTPQGQEVHFRLTPAGTLSGGRVVVQNGAQSLLDQPITGNLNPGRPLEITVPLTANAPAVAIQLQLTSRELSYAADVIIPVGPVRPGPISLSLVDQPLLEALKTLAPSLGRPVVIRGLDPNQATTVQVTDTDAGSVMRVLADGIGAEVRTQGGAFHLSKSGE